MTTSNGKRRPMPPAEQREALATLLQRRSKLSASEVELLREVFPAIMELHYQTIWAQIFRRVRDRARTDEVVQEVFLLAFRRIRDEGFTDSILIQLRRIALGEILNHARDERRTPVSVCLPSSGSAPPLTGPSPESNLDFKTVAEKLLPQLSDDHANVVGLILLDGLSYEEAEAVLDVPVATLKKRVVAAKKHLLALAMELLPPSQWAKR